MKKVSDALIPLAVQASSGLRGCVRVPGDKSISHRALILAALAHGTSQISGALEAADITSTIEGLRAFGVEVVKTAHGLTVRGGAWRTPDGPIHCGNAGTAVRLLAGAAAAQGVDAAFIGDASLSRRPMQRLAATLAPFGVHLAVSPHGTLPAQLTKSTLHAAHVTIQEGSAQLKSAALLAALAAPGDSQIAETHPARDHTERLLRHFGARLTVEVLADGGLVHGLMGPQRLSAADIRVPGDASSAAFLTVAALITPGSEITLQDVGLNPMRSGYLTVLQSMGGDIEITPTDDWGGEPVGTVRVRTSALRGVHLGPHWAPRLIDEYPVLAMAAAVAQGETRFEGIAALRTKESDRIAALVEGLEKLDVHVDERPDALRIVGTRVPRLGGVQIRSFDDHRIAMAFAVMGLACRNGLSIDDSRMIATSYPDFITHLTGLGADISKDATVWA
jgi:3-phosphoshikimate 1-carboxyvinyltransferase